MFTIKTIKLDGGHLGYYNYHSALVTTIKGNEKLITSTWYDDEFEKSVELNKTNKFEKRYLNLWACYPKCAVKVHNDELKKYTREKYKITTSK